MVLKRFRLFVLKGPSLCSCESCKFCSRSLQTRPAGISNKPTRATGSLDWSHNRAGVRWKRERKCPGTEPVGKQRKWASAGCDTQPIIRHPNTKQTNTKTETKQARANAPVWHHPSSKQKQTNTKTETKQARANAPVQRFIHRPSFKHETVQHKNRDQTDQGKYSTPVWHHPSSKQKQPNTETEINQEVDRM